MLKMYYSNPASLVATDVTTISAAAKSIDMAAYCMVESQLVAALHSRAQAGVAIRLYLDRTELESEARGDATLSHCPLAALLNQPNITIKVKESSILMHLKSYLVDGTMLRDGSANFSPEGEILQDNSLTLTDDPTACALFAMKFDSMWNRPDNLSVSEAVTLHATTMHRPPQSH